jgi:hypothetical protein
MSKESLQPIAEPLLHFLNDQVEILGLILLADRALSKHPELLDSFEIPTSVDQGRDERFNKVVAEALRRQARDGFPMLFEQAMVSLWGALECLIRDFLVNWLANDSTAMHIDAVRNIKISLADYEGLSEEDRYYYIVEMLEQHIKAPLKQGVTRFENVLGIFDLSGPVDEEVRKTLFELCNVRNVLVHKRGIADKRLVDACPWLGLDLGDKVVVTDDMFVKYFGVVTKYVMILANRVRDHVESHT